MPINQDSNETQVVSIQDRIAYLTHKLEEYKDTKSSLEKDTHELELGYGKLLAAKKQITENDEEFIGEINKQSKYFSPALSCVHSFRDSAQSIVFGANNQNSISSLQDAIEWVKKKVSFNETDIEGINKSIFNTNVELKKLRAQLSILEGINEQ